MDKYKITCYIAALGVIAYFFTGNIAIRNAAILLPACAIVCYSCFLFVMVWLDED